MNKLIFTLILLLNFTFSAQNKYDFYGVIMLNNDKTKIISYRVSFEEHNGLIKGYSVTDLDGVHETKNIILGTYNKKNHEFTFNESDIIYTKSNYNKNAFCFITYKGKLKIENNKSKLKGNFNGYLNNKQKCINGTLVLIGNKAIIEKLDRVSQKIKKYNTKANTNTNKKEIVEKYSTASLLDTLVVNKLSSGENLNVFWSSNIVNVEIWDSGKVDGDVISVFVNDKILLNDFKVSSAKKNISFKVGEKNVIKIVAKSEGNISTNTVKFELIDNEKKFEILSNLKKDQEAKITIIKR